MPPNHPRISKTSNQPKHLPGADLHVIRGDGYTVARFAAFIADTRMTPKGEMSLKLGIPYEQVPYVMELMKEIGGVLFEVTVRRVPADQLPEPGWI
jgi:hypothetical protein